MPPGVPYCCWLSDEGVQCHRPAVCEIWNIGEPRPDMPVAACRVHEMEMAWTGSCVHSLRETPRRA